MMYSAFSSLWFAISQGTDSGSSCCLATTKIKRYSHYISYRGFENDCTSSESVKFSQSRLTCVVCATFDSLINSQMRPIATDVVAWSACLLVTFVSPDITAESIEMLFGKVTRVGTRNHVLDGVQITEEKGQF